MKYTISDYLQILDNCNDITEVNSVSLLFNEDENLYSIFEKTIVLNKIDKRTEVLKQR